MKALIILNGPAGCGKSTIGNLLDGYGYALCDFKDSLISMALEISGISRGDWECRYESVDASEFRLKDLPWLRLGGYSQRQFLINLSENFIKPIFGAPHFGELLKEDLDGFTDPVFVNTSGGFHEELWPFLDDDDWTVAIVRLYRDGCTFDGDSRNYLHIKGIPEIEIHNNGTIVEAAEKVKQFIKQVKGE